MTDKIEVVEIIEATTGGTRRHLVDLVTHLDKSRFSVSVICSTLRDEGFLADIDAMKAMGVDIKVVRMDRSLSPVRDLLAFIRIYGYLRRHDFSVVHTHSSKAGFLGRIAAKAAGVPLIIHSPHVFAFEMDVSGPAKALYLRLERLVARWTDKIVCVCPSEKGVAVCSGVAPGEKLVVIENGVGESRTTDHRPQTTDLGRLREELGIGGEDRVVGMVARFTAQKGHGYLVLAAPRVAERFPNTRFVLIGDGELRAEIERLVRSLCLERNFVMCGRREDVRRLYFLFDVVVFPSLWEGMPYALLDAMQAGKAIVATKTGGMADAITDGRSGVLVPPRDADSLAQGILNLLKNRDECARLGAGAKVVMGERYGLAEMVRGIEGLYLKAESLGGA